MRDGNERQWTMGKIGNGYGDSRESSSAAGTGDPGPEPGTQSPPKPQREARPLDYYAELQASVIRIFTQFLGANMDKSSKIKRLRGEIIKMVQLESELANVSQTNHNQYLINPLN